MNDDNENEMRLHFKMNDRRILSFALIISYLPSFLKRFRDLNIIRPKSLYVEMVVNPCLYTVKDNANELSPYT